MMNSEEKIFIGNLETGKTDNGATKQKIFSFEGHKNNQRHFSTTQDLIRLLYEPKNYRFTEDYNF